MLKSFLQESEIVVAKALTAAGTSDTVASDAVPMAGYNSVAFVFSPTVIASGGIVTATVHYSDDGTNFYALSGAVKANSGDSAAGKNIVIEVIEVNHPYVKLSLARTVANVTLSPVLAFKFQGKNVPAIQGSTLDGSVQVASPAAA